MKGTQTVSFSAQARRHRDQRLRRFAEKIAAALAIAAFVYAGLFLVGHFNEAMELAAQSRSVPVSNVYYPNCAAARAAGAAPIIVGHPGYRPELDADGDGIACEPYLNRNQNG
jgi:micrococcal nuclease